MADGESWHLVHTPEPGPMPVQLEALETSSEAALEQLQAEGIIVIEGGEPDDGHLAWAVRVPTWRSACSIANVSWARS